MKASDVTVEINGVRHPMQHVEGGFTYVLDPAATRELGTRTAVYVPPTGKTYVLCGGVLISVQFKVKRGRSWKR